MIPFDLLNSPLKGAHLLEASAGTGKTYTIAGLYVRLILEEAIPVREILVVTFTLAATAELKDRIRRKLRSALDSFSRGCSDDAFLQALVKARPDSGSQRIALALLRAALRDFDEAAIFTIHGFCQRMLLENAFESGALFDTELVTDQQKIKTEIAQDFWRNHFYEALPELVWYALRKGYGPASFWALTKNISAYPDIRILHDHRSPSLENIRQHLVNFRLAFDDLRKSWRDARPGVLEKLHDPALRANVYGDRADRLVEAMDHWLISESPHFLLFEGFEKMTPGKLAAAVRTNRRPPEHPLFQSCEHLMDQAGAVQKELDGYLLSLERELIITMRTDLPVRKQKRNILFFDDLLLRLRDALGKEGGNALTGVIRKKFKAALIDEFQDTDPIQYTIFHTLFGSKDPCLYLIGDPKQAIYSFRGADIFAYLKAASQVGKRYSLDQNWRSDPGLIKAVNTLFSHARDPFVYDEIFFRPTEAAGIADRVCLTIDGKKEAPLQWWFIPAGLFSQGDKPLSKSRAREVIAGAVASEISRLIGQAKENRALIGDQPLREGDMAVLVRTNREARLIQQALQSVKIASVLSSEENIFDSHEAVELELLLRGILSRGDERMMRGAMITDMLGASGEALDRLMNDESAWSARLETFRLYRGLWETRGFTGMFRTLMVREGVKARLLSFPDGERRLTNLLHLSEILHHESIAGKLDMRQLLKWLSEQRNVKARDLHEEHLLRLESDANAVKIFTIHKSKGLEYPIVFCPFAWGESKIKDKAFIFHDERQDNEPLMDIGSVDREKHRRFAEKERLSENCRLLYVALTRAKHRCYFIWGRINETGSSAPFYLFHRPQRDRRPISADAKETEQSEQRIDELSDQEMQQDLEAIASRAGEAIRLRQIPLEPALPVPSPPDEPDILSRREFKGKIDLSWKVASFSLLKSGQSHAADLPDHDSGAAAVLLPREADAASITAMPSDIFTFPGGTKAGLLFHDLLEHFDFTESRTDVVRNLVTGKLQAYGFERQWAETLTQTLCRLVCHPLVMSEESGIHHSRPLSLSLIPPSERLNELEFYFPLKIISGERMNKIFGRSELWGKGSERLQFSPIRGFMHGFIDLIFRYEGRYYLADWKSNVLGPRVTDYHAGALMKAMTENLYFFQYHLYVTALHRYLSLRMPDYRYETHFGGVFYLFLRGMDPEYGPEFGVYKDRPPETLIHTLSEHLIEKIG
jgi:exodeoxyribonuclease V beta subunit